MTEEERDELYWLVHQDQDNRGYFDEPWWLGMEAYEPLRHLQCRVGTEFLFDEDAPF